MKMDAKAFEQSPTEKITFEISYHLKHGARANTQRAVVVQQSITPQ